MLFHRNEAKPLSALDPHAETIEDRTGMVANIVALEAGTVIPRGREFGALVAYRNGRGVVLYDGELRWGELVESRTGVRILLLDDAGPSQKLRLKSSCSFSTLASKLTPYDSKSRTSAYACSPWLTIMPKRF